MSNTIYIDGASRGNPGPAAKAVVILGDNNEEMFAEGEYIGRDTNNRAEYKALNFALDKAKELALTDITIYSDSELLIKQMKGEYKVKHPDLNNLSRLAKEKALGFDTITFTHIPREENVRADELANLALDLAPA